MKRLIPVLVLGALALPLALTTACSTGASSGSTSAAAADHSAMIKIEGMTCASCSVTVKTAAKKLDGVVDVNVNVAAGLATVTYDSSKVDAAQIAARISASGYQATVESDGGV